MYTDLKTYQQIIALLKKYNIKNCVLSAGSRNVPFVHSVEKDSFFNCYSVVDERSAGYFALGLAQERHEPVVISCTASTASCNYYPAVAEAFYQNVPIVILTSDRNPTMLGQREDQMINQVGMFDRHVRKSVNLPIIHDEDDEYYCERLINEALLELNHHGGGPVHINIPMKGYNNNFTVKELPKVKKIDRIDLESDEGIWNEKFKKLEDAKRIMVVCGQKDFVSDSLRNNIIEFFSKYNSVIIADHMSNLDFDKAINPVLGFDAKFINNKKMIELLPEIVISFGGQVFSGLKPELKKYYKNVEHWSIEPDGKVVDLFKSLKYIFECSEETFFKKANDYSKSKNNQDYYNLISDYVNGIKYPEFEFSHVYAIKNTVERIKENSILHLSINDSIRISNFFKIKNNINVSANIGTFGIDGPISTFIGHSVMSSKPAYLITGDLAFFYDMNALRLNSIKNNMHILLINNHGGSEFYYNGSYLDKYSDLHTTARHMTKAEGWVKSNNFKYISASTKEEFDSKIDEFINNKDQPILFEIFTEMSKDAKCINDFYNIEKPKDLKEKIISKSKNVVKKTLGQETAEKIAKKIGIIK